MREKKGKKDRRDRAECRGVGENRKKGRERKKQGRLRDVRKRSRIAKHFLFIYLS